MEQEVIASNSLSSNDDNDKSEEDKVPQLKLKQEPVDISTSQQSRWSIDGFAKCLISPKIKGIEQWEWVG